MEEKQEFIVDTEPKADWAFRKLKEIKEEEEKQKEKYKAHKEELEEWNKAKLGALEASKEHFTILLEDYYKEEKAKDPKFELDTPAGRLSFSYKSKWEYEDEELKKCLWERGLDNYLKVTSSIKKADIKKAFKPLEDGFVYDENGEKLEGVRIIKEPSFNLTLREAKWKEGEF